MVLLDSGSNVTLVNNNTYLLNYRDVEVPLQLAAGKSAIGQGYGYLKIGNSYIKAVYIPQINNILSVGQLTKLGYIILFTQQKTYIFAPLDIITQQLDQLINHYSLNTALEVNIPKVLRESIILNTEAGRIHCELAHISIKKMLQMGFKVDLDEKQEIENCIVCKSYKFKRRIAKAITTTTNKSGDHYSIDLSGPYYVFQEKVWLIVIVDEHSRFLKIIPTQSKKLVPELIIKFIEQEANRFGYYPSTLQVDMGTEFSRIELPYTVKIVSPVGNKTHNGRVERIIQTIHRIHGALTAHLSSLTIQKFLNLSFTHVANLYNILPHSSTGVTPISRYYNNDYEYRDIPLFLEDIAIYNNKHHRIDYGSFIRIDLVTHLYYVLVGGKEVSSTKGDFKRLNTFKLHDKVTNNIPSGFELFNSTKSSGFLPLRPTPFIKMPLREHPLSFLLNSVKATPHSFKQANSEEQWKKPIVKERNNFLNNHAFVGIKDINSLKNKVFLTHFWLFNYKSTGLEKARMIIIDPKTIHHRQNAYSSPVIKQTTFYCFLVLFSAALDLKLVSCDVTGAFLTAPIPDTEHNYVMKTPKGFTDIIKEPFVLLKKTCYGLNFSPYAFYKHFSSILKVIGYSQSKSDQCLHTKEGSGLKEVAIHHVDDVLSLVKEPQSFIDGLKQSFALTQPDNIDYFIGYELVADRESIKVTLASYIENYVDNLPVAEQNYIKKSMAISPSNDSFRPLFYPPESNVNLLNVEEIEKNVNSYIPVRDLTPLEFQHYTGVINYITTKMRFDIIFYSNMISRFNHCPNKLVYQQMLKLLHYLYQTRYAHMVIYKKPTTTVRLKVYSDASFHRSSNSYGGYIIFANDIIIKTSSWRIDKTMQHSYGAELFALHAAVTEARSIQVTLLEMGFELPIIDVFCDNLPLVRTLNTLVQLHMPEEYIYRAVDLRDLVLSKVIHLQHIAGAANPADIFTKKLYGSHSLEILRSPLFSSSFII